MTFRDDATGDDRGPDTAAADNAASADSTASGGTAPVGTASVGTASAGDAASVRAGAVAAAHPTVELALDAKAELGEGPVWDPDRQQLLWVNIMAGEIHRFDPATGADTVQQVGQPVGAVALTAAGDLVAAVRDGVALVRDDGSLELIAPIEQEQPDHRMNDAKCDAAGRFWAGTVSLDFAPGTSTLYRCDQDGTVTAAVPSMTLSNGMGWSPDNRTFYLIDTYRWRLDAFDFDLGAGQLSVPRLLIDFGADAPAFPDGMTVDADGGLWVAMYGAGAVRRYLPDGTLDRQLQLPARQPTCCAFGGADLGDLYITTARQQADDALLTREPALGGLFRVRPGELGMPAARFGR